MRRMRLLLIAALAALALALGACGGDDGGGTAEGDGEVTIFSLWGGSEQEAFKKVLTQFTEETGIRTKYESARGRRSGSHWNYNSARLVGARWRRWRRALVRAS